MRLPVIVSASLLLALPTPSLAAQEWVFLHPSSVEAVPDTEVSLGEDGSLLVTAVANLTRLRINCPAELEKIGALRIEALPHDSLPGKGPGHGKAGNFALSELRARSVVGRSSKWLELENPTASGAGVGWPAVAAIDARENTAWSPGPGGGAQEIVLPLAEPLGRGRRTITLDLEFHTGGNRSLGCLRVSACPDQGVTAKGIAAQWGKTQIAINKAIDKGVAYLLSEQELDGSWSDQQDRYKTGGTALVAYALMKSGVSKEHQAVRRALAYLAARPPQYTYEAGTQLMAFAAADKHRWQGHSAGILDELLDWQIGDWGYPGSHGDVSSAHKDLSNTQYGALGLWAAHSMGLDVPPPAWERLAQRILQYQTSDGGFGYSPGRSATGSMSAAGVTVLSLCLPHLPVAQSREVKTAQLMGVDWLNRNFSPTTNLGHTYNAWFHYYMYGIERVGAFAEIDQFNGQDWYKEGARQIIKQQSGKGNWADPWGRQHSTTSYCLLFLNKASAPKSGPGGGSSAVTFGGDDPARDVSLRASGDSPMNLWISSFGEKLFNKYVFEGDEKKGLRIGRVDYLTAGGAILEDSREGGSEWLYTTRVPEEGWAQPGFHTKGWRAGRGAFGRVDSPQLAVATEWTTPKLWMRRELNLSLGDLVDPELHFSFGAKAAEGGGVKGKLLKLYDEEEGFAALVTDGTGELSIEQGEAQNGDQFIRVTPRQKHRVRIPGWGFPIRAKPEEGEYRYLQFAWRKPGNVMLQLAVDGAWGPSPRYFAGKNQIAFNPAIEITSKTPTRWTVVTRDLWKDMGKDGMLTGLALTAMDDASADFDAIYLARTKGDFKHRRTMVDERPEWLTGSTGSLVPAQERALVLYLNGKEAAEVSWETEGFELLLDGPELRELLVEGRNVFAIHAQNSKLGRAVDISILDARRLATVKADPTRAKLGARYAARVQFPRPGEYEVWARIQVQDETGGPPVVVDSEPMKVRVVSALDPKLLEYATDSLHNLLAGSVDEVRASSELNGRPAAKAVDNSQVGSWVCKDGDAVPELEITLKRPVKADRLLLSHSQIVRANNARTNLPTRVEVLVNGRGDPIVAALAGNRLIKSEVALGRATKIRSLRIRILDQSAAADPTLTAVGFAEVELQLTSKR